MPNVPIVSPLPQCRNPGPLSADTINPRKPISICRNCLATYRVFRFRKHVNYFLPHRACLSKKAGLLVTI